MNAWTRARYVATRTAVLVAMLCAACVPVAAQGVPATLDLPQVRAKMVAAEGPKNTNYRVTIVGTGDEGHTIESTYCRDDDVLTTFSRGAHHTMHGTYHGEGWTRNVNGVTVAADPPDPDSAPAVKQTETLSRVTAPVDAFVIANVDAHGFGTRTFVDPQTYLVLHRDVISADGTTTITNLDYGKFGLQTLPAHWRYDDRSANDSMMYERVQFVAGSTTDADVAVPPVRSFVAWPSGAAVDLHAAFEEGSNHITIPVTIAGHTLTFIVSSAQRGIEIDADVAKRIGLAAVDEIAPGTAKTFQVHEMLIPDMDLSGLHLHDMVTSTGAYRRMNAVYGLDDGIVGTLGFDFFAELAVKIDYRHRRVTASDPRAFIAPASPSVSALDLNVGSQYLQTSGVMLDGDPARHMAISTFTSALLIISRNYANHHPKLMRNLRSDPLHTIDDYDGQDFVYGSSGYFKSRVYGINDVKVGTFAFQGLDAAIATTNDLDYVDGMIGSDFLSDFLVDFDVPHGRLYLTTDQRPKR